MPNIDEQPSYRTLKKQCTKEIALKEQLSQDKMWRRDRVNLSRVNQKIADLLWSCFKQASSEKEYLDAAQDFLLAFEYNHPKARDLYYKKKRASAKLRIRKFPDTEKPEQLLYQGLCYSLGLGRNQNREKAVELYHCVALSGHPTAMYFMAYAFHYGHGIKQRISEYIKWLTWSAEAGFAAAQNELGECYNQGRHVDKNQQEAMRWFRLAAEQNHAKGQANLGNAYSKGRAVEPNPNLAELWWTLAAEQGHAVAQYNLGELYWYCETNSKQQQFLAIKWLRRAAEQGHAKAQDLLGNAYWSGKGVREDKNEAVKWFHLAADQDHAEAQYSLGFAYFYGKGVETDLGLAKHWLAKSALNGSLAGQYRYGYCLFWNSFDEQETEGSEETDAEGIRWLKSAAEAGHLCAQKEFERIYSDDPDQYIPWLALAARQGDKKSLNKLKKLDRPLAKYHLTWITYDAQTLTDCFFTMPATDELRKTFITTDLPNTLKSKQGRVLIEQFIALIKKTNGTQHNKFLTNIYGAIQKSRIDKESNDDNPEYYKQLLNQVLKVLDFSALDGEHIQVHFDYLLDVWWSAPNDFSNLKSFQLLWHRAQYLESPCLENTGLLRQLASVLLRHHVNNTYTLNLGADIKAYQVEMLFSLLKCPRIPEADVINKLLGAELLLQPPASNPHTFFNNSPENESLSNNSTARPIAC